MSRQTTADPRQQGDKPPFPQDKFPIPGTEDQMTPKADHGEQSYKGSDQLKGKVALITGGDSGIGKAVAIAFAREGADVAISYLPEEEKDARDTAMWVEQAGRKCLLLPGDIGEESHCQQIVEKTQQTLGKFDILVNNAAFQKTYAKIEDITQQDLERHYRTNIFAMFYLTKAAMKFMKPGSAIINTSSIQAYQPSPELLAYASTKGAIVNFTKGLAKMLSEKGIRVNSVAPGPVWTPLIPSTLPEEAVKTFGQGNPTERPAQPAELAPAFVLLASDRASYINAAVVPVTGGVPTM